MSESLHTYHLYCIHARQNCGLVAVAFKLHIPYAIVKTRAPALRGYNLEICDREPLSSNCGSQRKRFRDRVIAQRTITQLDRGSRFETTINLEFFHVIRMRFFIFAERDGVDDRWLEL